MFRCGFAEAPRLFIGVVVEQIEFRYWDASVTLVTSAIRYVIVGSVEFDTQQSVVDAYLVKCTLF